ncbi:MAG: hypothetical protein MUC59_18085 [Saprospiraceae bacterium]|jgi:hypothetical protein|nr:hypothetical protein [Saprospiraceae bacterium]
MLTSNFELLVARIADTTTPLTPATAPFRKIVTGHFLTVTNLDPTRRINLQALLTITSSTGNSTIVPGTNVRVVFDNGSIENNNPKSLISIPSIGGSSTFRTGVFSLGPKQTGLLAILPIISASVLTSLDLAIRGYIELRQSRSNGVFLNLGAIPAADVLFTPETRGTFLDEAFPTNVTTDELDFDQATYALPTANGKSRDTVAGLPAIDFDFVRIPTREVFLKKNPALSEDEAGIIYENINDVLSLQKAVPAK